MAKDQKEERLLMPEPKSKLFVPQWVRYEIAPFLHGKGLCYGTQGTPISNPQSKTKDFYTIYGDKERVLHNAAVEDQDSFFRMFAKHTMDHVVLGPKADRSSQALKVAKDRLKPGGVFIYFGEENPVDASAVIKEGWYLVCNHPQFNPKLPEKSVAIIRYGALGDLVMITPLLEACKKAGEHVTLYTSPYALAVLENNPHIDQLIVQEKDVIAITELGPYFDYIKTKYTRFVDLCESIEGSMLKLESRREFYMPKEWRDKDCADNYYRKTLRLGGFPTTEPVVRGSLFLNKQELAKAKADYARLSGPAANFVWGFALHGTSHHKCYPLMQPLLAEYLADHPDERVVLLGSQEHSVLEFDHPQVFRGAGRYNVRELIGLISQLDAIVSPESFIANCAAAFDKPVITLLSHSSKENLCSTWLHDYSLEPDRVVAPCFPCHQLHYTSGSCPQREIIDTDTNEVVVAGAACTIGAIAMDTLAARMAEVYGAFGPKNKGNTTATS